MTHFSQTIITKSPGLVGVIFERGMLLIMSYIFERLHLTSYLVTFEKTIMALILLGFLEVGERLSNCIDVVTIDN